MKIEKLNDNQIRCTLTKTDLEDRQLHLSELAYGSEKAKMLFRDMMQQASIDCGFDADNTPLMIEAIPLPNETLVLIITKVEDPEELDTRFSKFAPTTELYASPAPAAHAVPEGADNVLDLFKKLLDHHLKREDAAADTKTDEKAPAEIDLARAYMFDDLDTVIRAAHVLDGMYDGQNSLYRVPDDSVYRLVVHKSEHTPELFNRVANILCEYGATEKYVPSRDAYLAERGALILADRALQQLAQL